MHQALESTCDGARIIANPTIDMIATLWKARLSNPEEVTYAFADASPNFDQFVAGLEKEELLCVVATNRHDEFIGAAWLHDLERDHEGTPRIGWIGGYVSPWYRGAQAVGASHLMLNHFHETGIHHIHTAIHVDNRKSQVFLRGKATMAFTYVCIYRNWTTFGGTLSDAVILTRHKTDKMLAWLCANRLASKRMLLQEVSV